MLNPLWQLLTLLPRRSSRIPSRATDAEIASCPHSAGGGGQEAISDSDHVRDIIPSYAVETHYAYGLMPEYLGMPEGPWPSNPAYRADSQPEVDLQSTAPIGNQIGTLWK